MGAGAAAATPCRLALVLAMDISSSVDAGEDALQRGGLARALRAPEVREAMLVPGTGVALTIFEWSGRVQQDVIVPWIMIETEGDLARAADVVAQSRRSYDGFATALGHALDYAADLFSVGPDCARQVLDVSGDGVNNDGPSPPEVYLGGRFDGVTVNALAIEVEEATVDHEMAAGVADYYRADLIHGPGAFVEVARGFRDMERAMRRKLLRELQLQIGMAR